MSIIINLYTCTVVPDNKVQVNETFLTKKGDIRSREKAKVTIFDNSKCNLKCMYTITCTMGTSSNAVTNPCIGIHTLMVTFSVPMSICTHFLY